MKIKLKKVIIVLCLVAVASLSVSVVYAAYYGKGIFKDVFVNRQNHFTSDILNPVNSLDDLNDNTSVITGATKFSLFNYDRATGEFNSFDLTFAFFAKLKEQKEGDNLHSVNYAGKSYPIEKTVFGEPLFTATLAADSANSVTIEVAFNGLTADNAADYSEVFVAAVPVTPAYMSAKIYGGLIAPYNAMNFEAHGAFQYEASSDIDDYAAFNYMVSMVGEPETESYVKVSWQADVLELITENNTLPVGVIVKTAENDVFNRCIELPAAAAKTYGLFFKRAELSDGQQSVWENIGTGKITWNTITNYIKTETV